MAEFWPHRIPVEPNIDWKRWGGVLEFCEKHFPRGSRFQTRSWQAFAWTHVAFKNEGEALFFAMNFKDEATAQVYYDLYAEKVEAAVLAAKEIAKKKK